MYKFEKYANHLNVKLSDKHKIGGIVHNINKSELENSLKSFYKENSDFYVFENNWVLLSLNEDFKKYVRWVIDD